jgi:putative hydrolase of the HAD superfamily
MTAPVRGVLVDLDDTLYPQSEFLDAAWRAVADAGERLGVDRERLLHALRTIAAEGSGRGRIIDRALSTVGAPTDGLDSLVGAFRAACPARLTPYPGVVEALAELGRHVPIAVVTDGEVAGQRGKLRALGLADAVDAVVISDAWGREFRKPHRRPFVTALGQLGISAEHAVVIGDRPDKDVAGAAGLGMRAIRVRTGEYAATPDHPETWLTAPDFSAAVKLLRPRFGVRRSRQARGGTTAPR